MKKKILASALAAAFASTPAFSQMAEPQPRIIVSGTGQAAVAPDMAILSLTVMRDAPTAREALTANNAAMADVLKAMKDEGIAEGDLQTAVFSINPRYHYPKAADGTQQEPKIVAYEVAHSLTVRIRDLAKVGSLLDTSVTLGVNHSGEGNVCVKGGNGGAKRTWV